MRAFGIELKRTFRARHPASARVGVAAATLVAAVAFRHFYPELHRYLRISRM